MREFACMVVLGLGNFNLDLHTTLIRPLDAASSCYQKICTPIGPESQRMKPEKELSICLSLLCLDLVSFPVLSQIKPQAPLLVVPFRQFL